MSRYHCDYMFSSGVDERLFQEIHQYMMSEGYTFRDFQGEMVYKKGSGFAAGPTFVKVMNNGAYVTVEAWIKFAVLPGVYAGEMGISGMAGAIPKSMLKARVGVVEEILRRWGGSSVFSGDIEVGTPQPEAVPGPAPGFTPPAASPCCHSCGAALQPQAAFCDNCGAPVSQQSACCPTCGQAVRPGQGFCAGCGAKLS